MSHRSQYLLFAAMSLTGAGLLAWAGMEGAVQGNRDAARLLTAIVFLGAGAGVYFFVHSFFEPTDPRGPAMRFLPSPEAAFEFSAADGA